MLVLLIERHLQRRGALNGKVSEWRFDYWTTDERGEAYGNESLPPRSTVSHDEYVEMVRNARYAEYACVIELSNDKDIPTSLRRVQVVFVGVGGHEVVHKPNDSRTATYKDAARRAEQVGVVNIPPHEAIHLEIDGTLYEQEQLLKLLDCKKAELRGYLPAGRMHAIEVGLLWR